MIGQIIWMDFLNNFVVKTIDNVYQGKTSNKIHFSLDDFVEFDIYLGNKIKQKYYKWKHNLNKNKHLEI